MEFDESPKKLSWWNRRTQMEKSGFVLLVITGIILLGLIIGICIISNDKNVNGRNDSVCLTPGCVKAAEIVLRNIDEAIDPCDDFYQFACGRYIKETTIPDDKAQINYYYAVQDTISKQVQSMLEEPIEANEPKPFTLAKTMYNICMNSSAIEADGLNTIKKIIKDVGGWPVLEGANWNENSFDWKTNMYEFRKRGLVSFNFITFSIKHDARNSTLRIISLDEGDLELPRENLLEGFGNKLVDAYYNYMVDLAVLFGANKAIAERDVRNMIYFKINLAKISLPREERRDDSAMFNPMTVAQLQNTYRSIPWLELINNFINNPNKKISSTSEINVRAPKYIEKLEGLLIRTLKRDQANFAFFQTMRSVVDYLPENIKNREQQYQAVIHGASMRSPRWIECTQQVSLYLQQAVGALYVRKHFDEHTRQAAGEMVSDVKKEFIKIVENLNWMDANTKKIAIDKAMAMAIHIGYPIEFLDDKKLEEYYAPLNFNSEDKYIEVAARIILFVIDVHYGVFSEPFNNTDWRTRISSTTINAGYSPEENSIQLPASILQGVFYDKNRPHYMNYGSIGYIIGHEMTHGFDDQGKRYNKIGGLEDWWAEETNSAYAERAKCFVKQYSEVEVPEVGMHLNGENTQGENIADNGGIKEAYLAYSNWVERNGPESTLPGLNYTAKQLFWISAANCWCSKSRNQYLQSLIMVDVHSPPRYRVMVPFSNTHYFAKDFNCAAGSKMISNHTCQIW